MSPGTRRDDDRPRLLIEEWLPVAALGVEAVRERAAASALPPLYFLHVWWARRPLVASAAAVLGSVMPAWTPELAQSFPGHDAVQTEDAYRKWFLKLCGILGDPVVARRKIDEAVAKSERGLIGRQSRRAVVISALVRCAHGPLGPRPRPEWAGSPVNPRGL
ncbi:MAG: DUF1156 domain-containing protein [Acidimicrobiaceae bacterium]|nr:DUF1156 domain-containing protein [Acidimicrobiaceae bacterium]MYE96516.1 DUF1156 domain-containing protein [Acidimicrobiaceae bacterium]MYI55287.1 DUF1156 domain-containing protein [Acidimicrobiaceae bacterium]